MYLTARDKDVLFHGGLITAGAITAGLAFGLYVGLAVFCIVSALVRV